MSVHPAAKGHGMATLATVTDKLGRIEDQDRRRRAEAEAAFDAGAVALADGVASDDQAEGLLKAAKALGRSSADVEAAVADARATAELRAAAAAADAERPQLMAKLRDLERQSGAGERQRLLDAVREHFNALAEEYRATERRLAAVDRVRAAWAAKCASR